MNETMNDPDTRSFLPEDRANGADQARAADLVFDHGLPGFAGARRFSLSSWGADDGPFSLMKCLDDTAEFLVATPDAFFPDYHPEIDDEVAGWLGITAPDDGLVLVIVTVPEQAKNATANLLGPLVINKTTRRSIQAVLSEDFSAREPLFRR